MQIISKYYAILHKGLEHTDFDLRGKGTAGGGVSQNLLQIPKDRKSFEIHIQRGLQKCLWAMTIMRTLHTDFKIFVHQNKHLFSFHFPMNFLKYPYIFKNNAGNNKTRTSVKYISMPLLLISLVIQQVFTDHKPSARLNMKTMRDTKSSWHLQPHNKSNQLAGEIRCFLIPDSKSNESRNRL